ncbi:hypothetical protein [Megasphaera cerevisiae]|uniref:hypothetical protein n=1 Tax=Megasphaera cerevisiae TaxID=39029 RepID=UPI0009CEDF76|nr:hypothetical protein [Megasphaera cerevisiae]SKA25289.1 hypothetical protein SAMN05660900_03033 [Megasphaera cerevisiae DSM 20462]
MKYNPDTIRKLIEEADERHAEKAHSTAVAIEKMLGTAADSIERDEAKKELVKALLSE